MKGPCQFPTLGFIVDRYLKHKNFVPEPFWKIFVEHTKVSFHFLQKGKEKRKKEKEKKKERKNKTK